jgi:hypothetical protein
MISLLPITDLGNLEMTARYHHRVLHNDPLPKTAKQLRKICKEKTAQEESIFQFFFLASPDFFQIFSPQGGGCTDSSPSLSIEEPAEIEY